MDLLTKIYDLANTTMTSPTNFSGFHIAFIVAVGVLTVLAAFIFKNCSLKTLRFVTAFVWVVIVLLEIYKQLVFSVYLTDGVFSWDYSWYAFPFQFCSSPLYILPIIAFTSNERLRNRCVAYMMTFALFAGLAVFCYPNDVFMEITGINYQTMIHHGSQIFIGVLYGVRYRKRLTAQFFFGGVRTFVTMVFIAMALNVGVYHMLSALSIDETFNMFYISPYFDCTLPVLSTVWGMVSYVPFVCVYFFGFILCALIIYSLFLVFTRGSRDGMSRKQKRLAYERDCIFYYNM